MQSNKRKNENGEGGDKAVFNSVSSKVEDNENSSATTSYGMASLFQLHSSVRYEEITAAPTAAHSDASPNSEEKGVEMKPLIPPPSNTATASTTASKSSWSYTPPNAPWSIHQSSTSLFSITYKYYHHCLPSYTNISYTNDITNRVYTCNFGTKRSRLIKHPTKKNKMMSPACCKNVGPKKISYYQDVYTLHDIYHASPPSVIKIKGIGECQAIQIHFKAKERTARYQNWKMANHEASAEDEIEYIEKEIRKIAEEKCHERISEKMKEEIYKRLNQSFAQHEENDDDNEKETAKDYDTLPTPPWNSSLQTESKDKGGNDESIYGPILTFAIQKNATSGATPPLLWKVQYPPDPTICIEAITMLDGALSTSPPFASSSVSSSGSSSSCSSLEENEPTHIYINGYQSWSFAGSVLKGKSQPMSAMPHFLSGAFNWGGSVPPQTTATSPDEKEQSKGGKGLWKKVRNKREKSSAPQRRHGGDNRHYSTKQKDNASIYISDFYTCITSNNGVTIPINSSDVKSKHSTNTVKLDEKGGPSLILGWLSQHYQYGVIAFDKETLTDVQMYASCDGVHCINEEGIETDWAYCQILNKSSRETNEEKEEIREYDEEPTSCFLHAVASYNHAKPLHNGLLTGWCSWYHYYENITEENLKENFGVLNDWHCKITSNVAIVDDGYMTAWGDWNSMKKNFPHQKKKQQQHGGAIALSEEKGDALKRVADTIRHNNMKPGLWLAPFACDKKSKLAQEHPDWIIKNDLGRAANSSNCGKFFYGLDATNPAVLQHAFKAIRRAVKDWGYRVLKLDFLYAACLFGNGKYDLSMTRAQAMHNALRTVREAAGPDAFIIGCGCPLGTAVGYVDGMRISADTGPTWSPAFPLPRWDNSTLPALRAMIRNSLTRSSLGHRWWHNDPDCVLLGETTSLTEEEVTSAATVVAMTGGMMLLSDDLPELKPGRFRVGTKIYPVTGATAVALDMHGAGETGFPSILRLWCTDVATNTTAREEEKDKREAETSPTSELNTDAMKIAKFTAFSPYRPLPRPERRERSCIRVASGLGTWSVVSLSNWHDKPAFVYAPRSALLIPYIEVMVSSITTMGEEESKDDGETIREGSIENPTIVNTTNEEKEHGYHVFSFWSSKYVWMPHNNSEDCGEEDNECDFVLCQKLDPHESEIFHIKPVVPDRPQYIGSDIHFTCGYEVRSFNFTERSADIYLKNDWKRAGHVFLYVPGCTNKVETIVNGETGQEVKVVAITPGSRDKSATHNVGRILKIWIVIHGLRSEEDGKISVKF